MNNSMEVHTDILFSHKNNRKLLFAGKWMELESIILSGVSQVQKAKGHMFSSNIMKKGSH
jgi:hypothetical protein